MNNPIIKVSHLSKVYHNEGVNVRVLTNLNFTIDKGEFVAIIGPSGSGKSTLMHILGALDLPTTGNYYLDSKDITNLTDRELAKIRNQKIGFVFQAYNLIPRISALENTMLPMEYAKISDWHQQRTARKYLKLVGLEKRLHYPPNKLSGGQQQRVAIARALVMNPSIILADEPTGNIAGSQTKGIIEIFKNINREYGHTVIMITHERDIARYAQRIISLHDGKIVDDRRCGSGKIKTS